MSPPRNHEDGLRLVFPSDLDLAHIKGKGPVAEALRALYHDEIARRAEEKPEEPRTDLEEEQ